MQTVTVIGRLLDEKGDPLRGAMVVNHAGRTVSEADGFFAVEMSERSPSLQVEYQGSQQCDLALDTARAERQQAVLLLGDLVCSAQAWASQ